MADDLTYRYAEQTWDADGVRTEYDIAFDGGYIDQSYVFAFSVLIDADTGLPTDRTEHTLTFLSEDTNPENGWKTAQVQITPAVAAGRKVTIFRDTPKNAPLVSYQDGSVLTKNNLDLANNQAIMAIAEIMDGLQDANVSLNQNTQSTINLTQLAQQLYDDVIQLLANGGIISSAPQVWAGVGDGETTDFNISPADIGDASFYDTYVAGLGLQPTTDYTIVLQNNDPSQTAIHFNTAPAEGAVWFTVLRGYSTPYSGDPPITSRAVSTLAIGPAETLSADELYRVLKYSGTDDTTFNIPASVGVDGCYFSVMSTTPGQVEIVAGDGVTLYVPAGLLPKTRGTNSVVSATLLQPASNIWLLSGDLAQSSELSAVAVTGSYDDLSDKPTIPADPVNADWNASSGLAQILNKPELRKVVVDLGTLTADSNVDLSSGDMFLVTLGANITLTFTNPPASGFVKEPTLLVTQDAGTVYTLSIAGTGTYAGGGSYEGPAAAGQRDLIGYEVHSDGSWIGLQCEVV